MELLNFIFIIIWKKIIKKIVIWFIINIIMSTTIHVTKENNI